MLKLPLHRRHQSAAWRVVVSIVVILSVTAGSVAQSADDSLSFMDTETFSSRSSDPVPDGFTGPFWSQYEALLYAVEGYNVPALITSSPAGTPPNQIGIAGAPTTSTLFGNKALSDDLQVGGRFRLGAWLDNCRELGVEGEFFGLGNSDDYNTSRGNSIVARPYNSIGDGFNGPAAEIVNLPGLSIGDADVHSNTHVYSAAPMLRLNRQWCCYSADSRVQSRFDLLAGYRFFHFGESLRISEQFQPDNGFFPDGTTYRFTDEYRAYNDFHGMELGFDWMRQRNRYTFELLGKVAIGGVRRVADIRGSSSVFVPNAIDESFNTGFYVNPDDVGRTVSRKFSAIPQVRVKIGYFVTRNLRVTAGYDFMTITSIIRPAHLIDQDVDPDELLTNATDTNASRRRLPTDSTWLQGSSIGLTYRF